jgi:hypothetical protein
VKTVPDVSPGARGPGRAVAVVYGGDVNGALKQLVSCL